MNASTAPPSTDSGIRVGALSVNSEVIDLAEAERIAGVYYGIRGQASRLRSERDQNFCIRSPEGHAYALRISNAEEDSQANDFQTAALLHIERVDPELPIPKVCRALDGRPHLSLDLGHGARAVRVLTFLEGDPLNTVPRSFAQTENMARVLARLGLALRGFFHPYAGHTLAWDLKNLTTLRPLMDHVDDPQRRRLVDTFLDAFGSRVAPALPHLRAQVVHNDLNIFNALAAKDDPDRIAGILDFGDLVFTPLAIDVAVGASFHIDMPGDPWDAVTRFVAAYHRVTPLEPAELDLMFDLVAARCVVTVLITGWRAKRQPENSAYILKNNAMAWRGLTHFHSLSRDAARQRLRDACNLETHS